MSPPCKMFEITDGPPEPAKSAAPDSIALNSAEEAPIKTGSNSMPYLSKMRASLATNHGKQLRPMGEKGKGTFFGTCAQRAPGKRSATTSRARVILPTVRCRGLEDGKSDEHFISDPPSLRDGQCLVYWLSRCQSDVLLHSPL